MIAEDFTATANIYRFCREYVDQYQTVPTGSVIHASYPDWAPPSGELAYWADLLRKYSYSRKAHQAIELALRQWDNPEQSIQQLSGKLSSLQMAQQGGLYTTDGSVQSAYDKYLMRKTMFSTSNGEHVFGVKTTFDAINRTNMGWLPGECIGIFSRPTVGKSWKIVEEAVHAWSLGYRVLFISPEMPANQIAIRIYACMAHYSGIPFSQKMAYAGNPGVDLQFARLVEQISGHERFLTLDSIHDRMVGIDDLGPLCDQFAPDMIFIDGISLMNNERNHRSTWEEMKYNAEGLKKFASRRSLPIMVSHWSVNTNKGSKDKDNAMGQAAGRGDDFRMPMLNDASFGDAFVMAMSTIIAMAPDQERSDLRWYSIRKIREREMSDQLGQRYAFYWDVDAGRIIDFERFGPNRIEMAQEIARMNGRKGG